MLAALGIAAVAAVVAIVVGGVLIAKSPDSGSSASSTSFDSFTDEELFAALCEEGTFSTIFRGDVQAVFIDAVDRAHCYSKKYETTTFIGLFPSEFYADNAIARFPGMAYASLTTTDGTAWAVVVMADPQGLALDPLEQWGFETGRVPRR